MIFHLFSTFIRSHKFALALPLAILTACLLATSCSSINNLSSGKNPFTNTFEVSAEFDNVSGLYIGNDVSVLGIAIGKITSIEPRANSALVKLSINSDVDVPSNVFVVSVAPSVVTDRHIELTPAYSSGPKLTDGSHVPLTRTKTPVDTDRLIASLDELSVAFSAQNAQKPLDQALTVTDNVLAGNGKDIQQTLSMLSEALKTGATSSEDLKSLITHLSKLSSLAAANNQQISEFTTALADASTLSKNIAPEISQAVANINALTSQISDLLLVNKDKLGSSTKNLNTTLDMFKSRSRELTEIIDVAPLLFQNMENAVDPLTRRLRIHFLTDKSLLDTDLLNNVCESLLMRSEGCRSGRLIDFGPDLGITALLLGLGNL
ncbi:MAG: MCE family protein [Mycobacteriaceae bacterium]